MVTLGGTCLLLFFKIIDFDDAFSAFSNPSILSIGVLFIVARAVEKVYILLFIYYYLLKYIEWNSNNLNRKNLISSQKYICRNCSNIHLHIHILHIYQ